MKRALCVGCNYPTKTTGLNGAVNDAFLISEMLQKHCGFEESNITVLHDVMPGQSKTEAVPPGKNPTRRNILNQLTSLISSARAGDTLFFSFSGYGLQVDDLDGYQDEGYDEAILPTDFMDGRDGDCTVVVTENLHDAFTNVPKGCSLTVLMDCDHASTLVDVSGTLDGDLVQGLKYQSLWCGMTTHSTKTEFVVHSKESYLEEFPRSLNARPRFHRYMNISNPRVGKSPHRGTMSRARPATFCYAASQYGQTSLELELPKICDGDATDVTQVHGVLTWSFARAMAKLHYDCTHSELVEALAEEIKTVKSMFVPRMDQQVLFTFTKPAADPQTMKVLQPLALKDHLREASKDSLQVTRNAARTLMMSKASLFMSTDSNEIFSEEKLTGGALHTDVGNGLMPSKQAGIDSEASSQTVETASTMPPQLSREMLSSPAIADQSGSALPCMRSSPPPSSPLLEAVDTTKVNTADDQVLPATPGFLNLFPGTSLQYSNIGLRLPSLSSVRSNSATMTPVRLSTATPCVQPALYCPSFFTESTSAASHATANAISHLAPPPRQHSPVNRVRTPARPRLINHLGGVCLPQPRQQSPVMNMRTAERRRFLSPNFRAAVPLPTQRCRLVIPAATDTARATTSSADRLASQHLDPPRFLGSTTKTAEPRNTTSSSDHVAPQHLEPPRISHSTTKTAEPRNTTSSTDHVASQYLDFKRNSAHSTRTLDPFSTPSPTDHIARPRESQASSLVLHAMSTAPHDTVSASNGAAVPRLQQRRSTITNPMAPDATRSTKRDATFQHPVHRTIINAVTDLTRMNSAKNARSPKRDPLGSPLSDTQNSDTHYATFPQSGQQKPISHAVIDLTQTLPFYSNASKYPNSGCALEGDGGTRTTMCSDGSRFTQSTLTGLTMLPTRRPSGLTISMAGRGAH